MGLVHSIHKDIAAEATAEIRWLRRAKQNFSPRGQLSFSTKSLICGATTWIRSPLSRDYESCNCTLIIILTIKT
ncbi:hypothetical protein EJD97_015530, partial [Solanum chilense]